MSTASPAERMCSRCGVTPADATATSCAACGAAVVSLRAPEDALLGKVLDDRFEIQRLLGRGGMGAVYLAHQRSTDREVAVKVIDPQRVRDRDAIRRFLREAKLVSQLAQPNTVSVFDFGQTADGYLYLVMERVQGRTLDRVVAEDGVLGLERAVRIALQLCDALEAAHAQAIVHRDLKPANVMVLDEPPGRDHVKVLDFGIAKTPESDITETGILVGTPRYMSPQLLGGAEATPEADLYALGVLLLEVTSGITPFRYANLGELIAQKMVSPILPDTVPPPLRPVIAALLDPDPTRRIATPEELRLRLLALEPSAAVTAQDVAPAGASRPGMTNVLVDPSAPTLAEGADASSPRPAPPRRWSRRIIALCLGGVVAIGGTAGWLWHRASRAPVISCPAPTHGPTIHANGLAPDEVWTADASPHIVRYDLAVRDGHTLTIEPCARVQLAAGAGISVAAPGMPNTGSLIAMGTAEHPIRFERLGAEPWSNIYVQAPATARLAHVELVGGGANDGPTLETIGDGVLPADPTLLLDHVQITGSGGPGLRVRGGATFLPGSDALTITGAGAYPAEIDEHAMDAFPAGRYTGNKIDEVLLGSTGIGVAGVGLTVDATLHDRGVPYRLAGSFSLGGKDGAPLATMTIEPGVVMRFPKATGLFIETFTGDHPAQAALHAVGTAERPIVFTSAEPRPAPGDWIGLWFSANPSAKNQIAFARIEYAGGECSCSVATCSTRSESEGAVILTQRPPSAFITNTMFAHSGNHGVTQGFAGEPLDFKTSNTFEDIAGCAQTMPIPALGCPDPPPACD